MCEFLTTLLNELAPVSREDWDDQCDYVDKDSAEELIKRAFKESSNFHLLNEKPPLNKFLLVKFEGEHEGGEFQFCHFVEGQWRDEKGIAKYPLYWSYIEKP